MGSAAFVPLAAGLANLAVGFPVLAGWAAGIPSLQSFVSGYPTMKPNAALALVLAGLGLVAAGRPSRGARVGVLGCGLAAALVGGATLVQYVAGVDLGIDGLLVEPAAGDPLDVRMSGNTALALALLGSSLASLAFRGRAAAWTAHLLALPVALVALAALIGYAYQVEAFVGLGHDSEMAVHTAALLALAAAGVLAVRPGEGITGPIVSPDLGGLMARRVLPVVALVPLLLGWAARIAVRDGTVAPPVALSLVVTLSITVMAGLVWSAARSLNRVSAQLRDERSRMKLLLESAGEGIFGEDPEGRCTFINPAAARMLGWPAEALLGRGMHPLAHHTRADGRPYAGEDCPIRVARVFGRPARIDTEVFWRKDGTSFPVDYTAQPILDERGGIVGVVVAFSDVSERRASELAIRRLNDRLSMRAMELAAVNKELEAFSYSVSHDLRSPLRSMDGFSQALLEDYAERLDETGRDYLSRIRAASQRMGQLIDDLLNLSRLTRGEMRWQPVDVSAMADHVVTELRRLEPDREVDVSIQPGLAAAGDPSLVQVVVDNLVRNAWKFTGKQQGARIEVGADADEGDRAVFFVRDNGTGFDMAFADKLFRPFQRLHGMKEYPGTGVGLATVQRIVHRHGGEVRAEGEPGRGATFRFSLPRRVPA